MPAFSPASNPSTHARRCLWLAPELASLTEAPDRILTIGSVTVPHGLVGWGGVDKHAPFHGFTIYLNDKATSCLLFSIAYRVDLDGDTPGKPLSNARPVQFGNRPGIQSSTTGTVAGTRFENVYINLEYPLQDERLGVGVILITPASENKAAKATLSTFLASFSFP